MKIRALILAGLAMLSLCEVRAIVIPVTHTLDEQSLAQLNGILQRNAELLSVVIRKNIRRLAFASAGVALIYLGISIVRDQLRSQGAPEVTEPPCDSGDVQASPFFLGESKRVRDHKAIAFGIASAALGIGFMACCDRV